MPDTNTVYAGAEVRTLRGRLELTQQQLGELLGLDHDTISRIEHERRPIRRGLLEFMRLAASQKPARRKKKSKRVVAEG